jgi:hypothetical protein
LTLAVVYFEGRKGRAMIGGYAMCDNRWLLAELNRQFKALSPLLIPAALSWQNIAFPLLPSLPYVYFPAAHVRARFPAYFHKAI